MERQVENVRKIPPKFVWRYEKSVSLCKALNLPNLFMSSSYRGYPRRIHGVIHTCGRGSVRSKDVSLQPRRFNYESGAQLDVFGEHSSAPLVKTFSTGDHHPQPHFIISVFLIYYIGDDNQWKALILFSSIIWVSGL